MNDTDQSIRYPLCDTRVDLSSANTFYRLLDSLFYMNQNGIVHFDIKPNNMLTKFGEVCLCDFGCADEISYDFFGYLNPTEYQYTEPYAPLGFQILHLMAIENPEILRNTD